MILVDLARRAVDLAAHYTDAGVLPRAALFLSWLLLVSLQNRNELILQSSDRLLRFICFWSLFLPLDKHWSLNRREKTAPGRVLSLAAPALPLQTLLMSHVSKLDSIFREKTCFAI